MNRRQPERLIRRWQKRLRLEGWDIVYDPDTIPEDSMAEIQFYSLARTATISIDPDVGDGLELHIVHEMMHLLIRDYADMALADIIKPHIKNKKTLAVLAKMLSDEEEKICWKLAKILIEEV